MNNQRAQFILQSCRTGAADARDPQFTEALQQAAQDPALAEWFAHEQALDAAISRKLQEVTAPDALRQCILAGHDIPPQAAVRRSPALLALAASVVLLATMMLLWFRSTHAEVNLAAFQREMQANVSGGVRFSLTSADVTELQQWLADQREVSGFTIPAALKAKASLGCRTWTWNGRPVGLICFLLDGKQAVHLFVVDRTAVPDAPDSNQPRFIESDGWTTAAWSEGGKSFLLMGQTDRATIAKLL